MAKEAGGHEQSFGDYKFKAWQGSQKAWEGRTEQNCFGSFLAVGL